MIVQFLLAMTATASFAVLFGVPKEQFLFSSLTGALGWISFRFFVCNLFSYDYFTLLCIHTKKSRNALSRYRNFYACSGSRNLLCFVLFYYE